MATKRYFENLKNGNDDIIGKKYIKEDINVRND